jgi:4-hydroxybenzoate polyprenyltransferase
VMAVLFFYQHWLGRSRLSTNYFKAFINSHWAALSVWLGLLIDYG